MNLLLPLLSGIVSVVLLLLAMKYRADVKAIERALGRAFVAVVTRGGDGILAGIINNQDLDFVFFPITKRDNNFYYIEIPMKGKGGIRKEHFKISKDDVFLLRNRLLVTFILRDKIRAINLDHIKTVEILDDATKTAILRDYMAYRSLMNEYKNLSAQMLVTKDEREREELDRKRRRLLEEAEAIKKRWGAIFGTLEKEKALVIEEKDKDGKVLHILRTINFEKFSDVMTGVRPNEIYDTAVSMYNRWILEFLKDWSRAFRIPTSQMGGSNTLFYLLIFAVIILFIIMAFRGGG